jgi:fatty-acyl-CoA synthase
VATLGGHRPAGMITRHRFEAAGASVDDAQAAAWAQAVTTTQTGLIVYTSGTTANPRGAMLTHGAFVGVWLATGRTWGTTVEDRQLNALPMFHVTALGSMTWILGFGATFLSDRSVDAGRTLDIIERERVTQFYPAYQPVMEGVVSHPRFADADLSSMRMFLNVAPPEVLAKFQARIPHAIQLTTYGGTESGCATLTRPEDDEESRIRTCGPPQPGHEVRICGPGDEPLEPGVVGEIHLRGPNLLSGYYNHPEKDAEAFAPDGWFRTGDLGSCDAQGRLMFLGRLKEVLKVGGENVGPQEIEEQLCTHPAVRLVQVVGMPDERLVEVPAAFVELVPGGVATAEELIDHVRGRIASFKVPRLIRFVTEDEWPMSTTKIQRTRLRERLLAELEQEALASGAGR